jgi:hypothetical protein
MNNYKAHQEMVQRVKLEIIKNIPNLFVFDRHVGLFKTINGTPIKIGIPGQADLWAVYNNGNQLVHHEIEIKTGKATQTTEQKNWQHFIEKNNGIYTLARSENDVQNLLDKLK